MIKVSNRMQYIKCRMYIMYCIVRIDHEHYLKQYCYLICKLFIFIFFTRKKKKLLINLKSFEIMHIIKIFFFSRGILKICEMKIVKQDIINFMFIIKLYS